MEVGTGRALSAVILVTWTATPGETARARRGSKNSCVPSPGPAPFFFYLRSSFNILAEPSRARTEKERERENGRRQIFTRPASKSSLPSFAPSSSKFFVGLVRRSRRNKHQTLPSRKAPLIVLNAIDNLDIARMYTKRATRMLAI